MVNSPGNPGKPTDTSTSTSTGATASKVAGDVEKTAREEASKAGRAISEEARAVAGQAGELGRQQAEQRFEQGKESVEGQVEAIGSAVDGAARRLREEDSPLASYAEELSGQISRLSGGIQNSSLDDIAMKTRRVAQENPGLFMLGSVVAGIAAARFFKASAPDARPRHGGANVEGGYGYGERDGYGSMGADRAYRSPLASEATPYRDGTGAAGARVPLDSREATTPPLGGTISPGTTTPGSSSVGTAGSTQNKGDD